MEDALHGMLNLQQNSILNNSTLLNNSTFANGEVREVKANSLFAKMSAIKLLALNLYFLHLVLLSQRLPPLQVQFALYKFA